ncbi:MAG: PQQ-dependent sugar dehydrogenase [Planctomycetota bacterium]|jgi:glucose/arabinose dehydrogenase
MMRHLLGILLCTLACPAAYGQTLFDLELAADLVAEGLGSSLPSYHTGMVFINDDTLLAIDRGQGIVIRVDLEPGVVAVPGPVVLDLDVIAAGDDHQSEYGVQGIAVHPDFAENGYVYIRYDQSPTPGVDTPQDEVVLGPNFSASHPTENVIERYIWVPDANGGNGELLFDSLIHSVTVDTRYHHGGKIVFGPDGTLHAIYGDLRRYAGGGWLPGQAGPLLSVNVKRGVEEDNGTVLRLNDDGTTPPDNPYDPAHPKVPDVAANWYAYGIRNSFGLAVDPATGNLWDTENGPMYFDEVNLIEPGSNGGWKWLIGPAEHPAQTGSPDDLVALPGSAYSEPEFSWYDSMGVTAIHFLFGSLLGEAYDDRVLVGTWNHGHLFWFRLDDERRGFVFETPALQDLVDDRPNAIEYPVGPDGEEIVLGVGFGSSFAGTLVIERGPDGWPYLLTARGKIYRLRLAVDLNADGTVGILDFLLMLAAWGPCADPCPPSCAGDLNGDCDVGVIDFLGLLARWD